jgi:hypothetical protein
MGYLLRTPSRRPNMKGGSAPGGEAAPDMPGHMPGVRCRRVGGLLQGILSPVEQAADRFTWNREVFCRAAQLHGCLYARRLRTDGREEHFGVPGLCLRSSSIESLRSCHRLQATPSLAQSAMKSLCKESLRRSNPRPFCLAT